MMMNDVSYCNVSIFRMRDKHTLGGKRTKLKSKTPARVAPAANALSSRRLFWLRAGAAGQRCLVVPAAGGVDPAEGGERRFPLGRLRLRRSARLAKQRERVCERLPRRTIHHAKRPSDSRPCEVVC